MLCAAVCGVCAAVGVVIGGQAGFCVAARRLPAARCVGSARRLVLLLTRAARGSLDAAAPLLTCRSPVCQPSSSSATSLASPRSMAERMPQQQSAPVRRSVRLAGSARPASAFLEPESSVERGGGARRVVLDARPGPATAGLSSQPPRTLAAHGERRFRVRLPLGQSLWAVRVSWRRQRRSRAACAPAGGRIRIGMAAAGQPAARRRAPARRVRPVVPRGHSAHDWACAGSRAAGSGAREPGGACSQPPRP